MRSLNATQLSLLAANARVSWLFTVTTTGAATYRWSTKEVQYGGNTYTARIIRDSLNRFVLAMDSVSQGMVAPADFSFSIINESGAGDEIADPSDLDDADLNVNAVMRNNAGTESSVLQWAMKIKAGVPDKQTIRAYCTNLLSSVLKGDYPKTKYVKELEETSDLGINDSLCVPIPFGTCYPPIRSVYVSADQARHYVLGPSTYTYNVTKIHSPRDWPLSSEWESGSYTLSTSNKTLDGDSMKVLYAEIADSDENGTADAQGLWLQGDKFLDPAVQFYRSDTRRITGDVTGTHTGASGASTLTDGTKSFTTNELVGFYVVNRTDGSYGRITANTSTTVTATLSGGSQNDWDNAEAYTIGGPASILRYIMLDMGLTSAQLSDSAFGSAEKSYAGWALTWNGALFSKESKTVILGRLLDMCFSRVCLRDTVALVPFSKTSVLTVDASKVISSEPDGNGYRESTFQIEPLFEDSETDSGYILWQESGKPQDSNQRVKVSHNGTDFDNVSSDEVFAGWIQSSINAQRIGERKIQRKYRKKYRASFQATAECAVLEPGDTITLSGLMYGGSVSAVVESVSIGIDFDVDVSCIIYKESLADFTDTVPSSLTYADNADTLTPWRMLSSGPSNTPDSGHSQNVIFGHVRIGAGTEYILLDHSDPAIKLYDPNLRCVVGKIGTSNYGVAFYDNTSNETIVIDATRKVIKEMQYEIYTTGIIQTDSDILSNGGCEISHNHIVAYSDDGTPLKVFEVVFNGTDWGDFYVGDYANDNSGMWYDHSDNALHFRGDVIVSSLGHFPAYNTLQLGLSLDEPYGTVRTDQSANAYDFKEGTTAPTINTSGVVGYCNQFTTSQSSISSNSTTTANLNLYNKQYLISVWFWPTTGGSGNDYIYYRYGSNNGVYVYVNHSTQKVSMTVGNGTSSSTVSSNASVNYDAWNHAVIAVTGGLDVSFYLDGEFDVDRTLTYSHGNYTSSTAYVGNYGDAVAGQFYGQIDELRIYAHATLLGLNTYKASYAKALYMNPDGSKGGRISAKSVMIGNATSGWYVSDDGIFGKGGGNACFALAIATTTWDGVSIDAGDFVIGRYLSGYGGMHYDASVSSGTLYIRGDIDVSSFDVGIPNDNFLAAYWSFDEGYGTKVIDGSSNKYNLTFDATYTPTWHTNGLVGATCLNTTAAATTSQVAVSDDSSTTNLDFNGKYWTFSAWIYPLTKGGGDTNTGFFFRRGTAPTNGLEIYYDYANDRIVVRTNNGSSHYQYSTSSIYPQDEWVHVAITCDKSYLYFYYNGEFVNSTAYTAPTAVNTYTYVGAKAGSDNQGLDGVQDQFRIYNHASNSAACLTAKQIKALYLNPSGNRSGRISAHTVVAGNPSGSDSGWRLDATGAWGYGASGAELFGFCTSGTISWNSQSLTPGHFVLGDYNGGAGIHYNGTAFRFQGRIITANIGSGNTLTVNGGSISISSGSLYITTSGSFTMDAGTFTISAGTASITAANGLSFGSASGAYFGTTGKIVFSSGNFGIYTQGSSGTNYLYLGHGTLKWGYIIANASTSVSIIGGGAAAGELYLSNDSSSLRCLGSYGMVFTSSSIKAREHFYPYAANTWKNGDSTLYWLTVYGYTVGYVTADPSPWDDYDDIELAKKITTLKDKDGKNIRNVKGQLVFDIKSIPKGIMNLDTMHDDFNKHYGTTLTPQDIDDVFEGKKKIKLSDDYELNEDTIRSHLITNVGQENKFLLGVCKQLIEKTEAMETRLLALEGGA